MYHLFSILELSDKQTVLDSPSQWLQTHGINIIIIIFGAIAAKMIISAIIHGVLLRGVRTHFGNETDRKKRLATLEGLIDAVLKLSVFLIGTLMIISELGINTGPILASAGVAGVALGIGAQSLIRDFMSGFFIIAENQYRVGDVIDVFTNVGGIKLTGTVEAITVRTTLVRDLDGMLHHIPNGSIMVASNKTFGLGRINEDIVVDPDTDLKKLETTINRVGKELAADEAYEKRIRKAPRMAEVTGYNERGVIVKILGDTSPGSQWDVRSELYRRLRPALKKDSVSILFTPVGPAAEVPAAKKTK